MDGVYALVATCYCALPGLFTATYSPRLIIPVVRLRVVAEAVVGLWVRGAGYYNTTTPPYYFPSHPRYYTSPSATLSSPPPCPSHELLPINKHKHYTRDYSTKVINCHNFHHNDIYSY